MPVQKTRFLSRKIVWLVHWQDKIHKDAKVKAIIRTQMFVSNGDSGSAVKKKTIKKLNRRSRYLYKKNT